MNIECAVTGSEGGAARYFDWVVAIGEVLTGNSHSDRYINNRNTGGAEVLRNDYDIASQIAVAIERKLSTELLLSLQLLNNAWVLSCSDDTRVCQVEAG